MFTTLDFVCIRLNKEIPEVLLLKREKKDEPAFGEFGLIGGMIWEKRIDGSNINDENIDDAVSRILALKVGDSFKPSYVEQMQAVGSSTRDSRGWSITIPHLCLFKMEDTESFDNNEKFKWVSIDAIKSGEIILPFDHSKLIDNAFNSLVTKARYSSVLFYLLNKFFTVNDIIGCFGSFGFNISKQTINKRWIRNLLILPTGTVRKSETRGKASALYFQTFDKLHYFEFSLGI